LFLYFNVLKKLHRQWKICCRVTRK